ncbi:MAG: OmpA family protein [Dinghuibacter sp.]|nr:OmpA family protein [Dinghuibacter sp.]
MKTLLIILLHYIILAQNTHSQQFTLYFDYNRYDLRPESVAVIDSIARLFRQNGLPQQVYINAHCDSIGNNEYNYTLSEQRAIAVADALLNRLLQYKLERPEMMIFPNGRLKPVAGNETEQGRQLNRRVDISFSPVGEQIQPILSVPTVAPVSVKQEIEQATEGKNVVLHNLHFQGGLRHLVPASVPVLEDLLAALQANPKLEIAIEGHICCVRGPQDGPDLETGHANLSVQRAKTVYDYLVQKGIEPKRLSFRGLGHQFPVTAERTEAEMQQNRRVEIRIVKK